MPMPIPPRGIALAVSRTKRRTPRVRAKSMKRDIGGSGSVTGGETRYTAEICPEVCWKGASQVVSSSQSKRVVGNLGAAGGERLVIRKGTPASCNCFAILDEVLPLPPVRRMVPDIAM